MDVYQVLRTLETMPFQHHEQRAQLDASIEECSVLYRDMVDLDNTLTKLKMESDGYRTSHERLECLVYDQEQEINRLKKQTRAVSRQKEDTERRLQAEMAYYDNERTLWIQREHELSDKMKQRSLQSRQVSRRSRSATIDSTMSMSPPSHPTPSALPYTPSGTDRLRPIRMQDQRVVALCTELQEQRRQLHDTYATTEMQAAQMDKLENELLGLKQLGAALKQDNESYRVLLCQQLPPPFSSNNISHDDAPTTQQDHQDPRRVLVKDMAEKVAALQESNKALTLYMDKILMKIVDDSQLVNVLSIDDHSSNGGVDSRETEAAPKNTPPTLTRPRRNTVASWIPAVDSGNGWTGILKHMTSTIGWSSNNNNSNNSSQGNDRRQFRKSSILFSRKVDLGSA